jgi:hypothetical protein
MTGPLSFTFRPGNILSVVFPGWILGLFHLGILEFAWLLWVVEDGFGEQGLVFWLPFSMTTLTLLLGLLRVGYLLFLSKYLMGLEVTLEWYEDSGSPKGGKVVSQQSDPEAYLLEIRGKRMHLRQGWTLTTSQTFARPQAAGDCAFVERNLGRVAFATGRKRWWLRIYRLNAESTSAMDTPLWKAKKTLLAKRRIHR